MMKIKATTPCYKFINAYPDEQQDKLMEEVLEVMDAWKALNREYNYENLNCLLMELLDVKACVNTAIAQLELFVEKENIKQSALLTQISSTATMAESLQRLREINSKQIIFECCLRDAKDAVIEKNLRRGYYVEDEK